MKKSILMMLVIALVSFTSQAQSTSTKKKATFTVYGNCGMCKTKIEGALKGTSGIYKAVWNVDTKKMTVNYNPQKTTLAKIKQRIANVGYDSDSHRAKKATYDKLHGCCKYERPKK
jgi:periplasmic mercuric ion binding protein